MADLDVESHMEHAHLQHVPARGLVDNPFSIEFSRHPMIVVGMDTFMFDESSKEKPAVPDSVLQNLLLKVSSSC